MTYRKASFFGLLVHNDRDLMSVQFFFAINRQLLYHIFRNPHLGAGDFLVYVQVDEIAATTTDVSHKCLKG